MEIELHKITVREIVEGYEENDDGRVVGYGGRLNIRPAFQREFVYGEKQRNEVIRTINKGFPLNSMYWVRSKDGNFEMLDGQQRTISICRYVSGIFSIGEKKGKISDRRTFGNLSKPEQNKILDYELHIYICDGDDKEKLDWFQVINIAGVELTPQELRNAIFACEWLSSAKKYFSKPNCLAYSKYGKYLSGQRIRQEYLETALKWIADRDDLEDLADYMDMQKTNDTQDASELWNYFEEVFAWVNKVFPKYRGKIMKGQAWGIYYNRYGQNAYDAAELEKEIARLLKDFDVTNQRGIYEYLLGGKKNEKLLSIRQFDERMKATVYERQKGICPRCKKHFELEEMHADHIVAWSKGGKTVAENCQLLCAACNREKSDA